MCSVCGCEEYLTQGKQATLKRALELVQLLGVTEHNAQAFEDGEIICSIIGPKVSVTEMPEVYEVVSFLNRCHEHIHQEVYRKGMLAAQNVFGKLPAKGEPREVLRLYHQLEQLSREISEKDLSLLADDNIRRALLTIQGIHGHSNLRRANLAELYGLSVY